MAWFLVFNLYLITHFYDSRLFMASKPKDTSQRSCVVCGNREQPIFKLPTDQRRKEEWCEILGINIPLTTRKVCSKQNCCEAWEEKTKCQRVQSPEEAESWDINIFLDDLILERERANERIRNEMTKYLDWCNKIDQNSVPDNIQHALNNFEETQNQQWYCNQCLNTNLWIKTVNKFRLNDVDKFICTLFRD